MGRPLTRARVERTDPGKAISGGSGGGQLDGARKCRFRARQDDIRRADLPASRPDLEKPRIISPAPNLGGAWNPTSARSFDDLAQTDVHGTRWWAGHGKGGIENSGKTHGRSFHALCLPKQSVEIMSTIGNRLPRTPNKAKVILRRSCRRSVIFLFQNRALKYFCHTPAAKAEILGIAAFLPSYLRPRMRQT